MNDRTETVLTAFLLAAIMCGVYWTYEDWQDCRAKGGVYLAQQFTCIKAEVL